MKQCSSKCNTAKLPTMKMLHFKSTSNKSLQPLGRGNCVDYLTAKIFLPKLLSSHIRNASDIDERDSGSAVRTEHTQTAAARKWTSCEGRRSPELGVLRLAAEWQCGGRLSPTSCTRHSWLTPSPSDTSWLWRTSGSFQWWCRSGHPSWSANQQSGLDSILLKAHIQFIFWFWILLLNYPFANLLTRKLETISWERKTWCVEYKIIDFWKSHYY